MNKYCTTYLYQLDATTTKLPKSHSAPGDEEFGRNQIVRLHQCPISNGWEMLVLFATALGKLLPLCKSVLTAASGHLLIFDKNARPAAKQACLTAVAVAV